MHNWSEPSRREFLVRCGQNTAMLALLSSCAPISVPLDAKPVASPESPVSSRAGTTAATLDEKIGQMIMVGFRSAELKEDNPIVQDLRTRHIGGVVLFDYDVPTKTYGRNIQSPRQVKELCVALQNIAPTRLLIAVDQEGGFVGRLKEKQGFPSNVSQQFLGALNNLDTTRQYAETTARTLAEAGINLNLAPVVDLNTNPTSPAIGAFERSFSADPNTVTLHAREVVQAHRKFRVLTTLKHFPGHGSARDDSHLGFVDVTQTWTYAELEPYARLIAAQQCDAVMTAHIFNANLDPILPATLSKTIITGILREQLQFDGVVISDDMQMKAIADHYGFDTAIFRAIDAGVDIIAVANNSIFDEAVAARTITAIQRLVQEGKITAARLEQSYQRIMRLKGRLG